MSNLPQWYTDTPEGDLAPRPIKSGSPRDETARLRSLGKIKESPRGPKKPRKKVRKGR